MSVRAPSKPSVFETSDTFELGRFKRARRAYGFDEVALVPGRVTINPLEVDIVVVSVGRSPRGEGSGFREQGVTIDDRGFVSVDGNMRTSADGVYSVGDVVATPQLARYDVSS